MRQRQRNHALWYPEGLYRLHDCVRQSYCVERAAQGTPVANPASCKAQSATQGGETGNTKT